MKSILVGSLLLLTFIFSNSSSAQSIYRKSFNDNWNFQLNDGAVRKLNLPHDWSIELPFDSTSPTGTGGGALRGGFGLYEKTFSVSEQDRNKKIYIDFDGVYMNSEVLINGQSVGTRPNGYISFRYDLTPYLKYGKSKKQDCSESGQWPTTQFQVV